MRAYFKVSVFAALALACDPDASLPNQAEDEELVREGARTGCIERAKALDLGGSSSSAREARELAAQAEGDHVAELTWLDGTRSRAALRVRELRALQVHSREDPDFHLDIGRNCVDRVRLSVELTLASDDGRLDETFANVAFERAEAGGLSAWFHRKREQLGGEYVRQSSAARGVLSNLYFGLTLAPAVFDGDVSEEITSRDSAELGGVAMFRAVAPGPDGSVSLPVDAGVQGVDASPSSAADAARDRSQAADGGQSAVIPDGAVDAGASKDAEAAFFDAARGDAAGRDARARGDSAMRVGCFSDHECAALPGTKCSSHSECLSPPGCGGSMPPCPPVCYGYCK